MKHLILFLILLNVLFWGWSEWVAAPVGPALQPTPALPVAALRLQEEVYPDSVARPEPVAPEPDGADAEAAGTGSPPAPEPQNQATPPETAAAVVAPPVTETEPASDAAPAAAGAAAGPEDAGAPAAEAEPPPPVTQAQAPAVAAVSRAPNPNTCYSLGPFQTLGAASKASATLRARGLATGQRLEESEVWVGHWVHLPPLPNRQAAIAVVERLREGGVTDIYIEPSGDNANAVSLGLFSDAERAEIRAGIVRRLGVKPQIQDRYRVGSVYWVDLPPGRGADLDPAQFADGDGERLELAERPCAGA